MSHSPLEVLESEEAAKRGTPAKRPPVEERPPARFDVRSVALGGLFILAVFYTIFFMRAVLLPLVLALLLSYLLRPIVRALKRVQIPPAISSAFL